MASSAKPLKSILKKPAAAAAASRGGDGGQQNDAAAASAAPAAPATHSRRLRSEQDNAEIARKHAAILQQRKNLEATIFQSIEKLAEFPRVRGPDYSSAHPAAADAAAFVRLVRVFQPGDYDDLIEERNTCGRCGYALCPNPRRTFPGGGGAFTLVHATKSIVPKAELAKWCSAACARRALYIKVQLNETAAWERVGIPDIEIELLEEGDEKESIKTKEDVSTPQGRLAQDLARLKLGEERRLAENARALAFERGDASLAAAEGAGSLGDEPLALEGPEPKRFQQHQSQILPPAATGLVDVNIVEKKVTTAPRAPTLDSSNNSENTTSGGDSHMVVEGHKIRFTEE